MAGVVNPALSELSAVGCIVHPMFPLLMSPLLHSLWV